MARRPTLSRDQVREVDRLALEELGIPGLLLMENAGRGAAELARRRLLPGRPPAGIALVLCGTGNNGGDGWVVARHLSLAGVAVRVGALQPAQAARGDAAIMRAIVERMGLAVRPAGDEAGLAAFQDELAGTRVALVVDGLLGTGFRGALRPEVARAIRWVLDLRRSGARVLALDLPSGLDCDTGEPADPTVRADLTATFVAPKRGFLARPARPFLGRVVTLSIGAPELLIERVLRAPGTEAGGRRGDAGFPVS
jgi:NAD(P)H-hydrate epimerase